MVNRPLNLFQKVCKLRRNFPINSCRNLYIPKYSKNTQEIIFFKTINFVITHRIFKFRI